MMDFDQISKGLQTSGLQLDGFELEAHALWNKLENLASNDPVQYQQFIDQAVALKKGDKNEENKSFRPEPGFCIKTISLGGYKKRKIILGRENNFGLNIYVNFCHHPAVDPARNGNSIANLTDFQSSANIEIPLAVGFVREITVESAKKEDLVIDVVFHSDVLSASQYEPFKTSLIQLALRAISEDEGIKLDLSHIVHLPKSKRYVGGLDANEGTPVRFIVQTNLNSTKTQELSLATITKEINNQLEGNQCLCASSVALITSSSIKKSRPKITVLPDIKIKSYFEIDSKLGDHLTLKVKEHDGSLTLTVSKLPDFFAINSAEFTVSAQTAILRLQMSSISSELPNEQCVVIRSKASVKFDESSGRATYSKAKKRLIVHILCSFVEVN